MRNIKLSVAIVLALCSSADAQSTFVTTTQNTSQNSIVLSGPHTLVAFHATGPFPSGAVILVWDSSTLPATGAQSNIPKGCFAVPAQQSSGLDSTLGMSNTPDPIAATTGLAIALSAATGSVSDCYTYTPVSGYLSVIYQ